MVKYIILDIVYRIFVSNSDKSAYNKIEGDGIFLHYMNIKIILKNYEGKDLFNYNGNLHFKIIFYRTKILIFFMIW